MVAAFAQDIGETSPTSSTGRKEARAIQREIEVLESATVVDVRKLIAAFCSDIPLEFEFEKFHCLSRSAAEEKCTTIDEFWKAIEWFFFISSGELSKRTPMI